ncbi:MAG: NAD(P)H-dependent oxidoreductase [Candidatus Roizmanbacteria bacterium]
MIINFHPKELPSKKGLAIIAELNKANNHKIYHSTDKSADEWKAIILGDEQIILIAPVFWWAAGYEFDKWIQNVLTYGFAYRYSEAGTPEGMLKGRAFEFHLTHGTPEAQAGALRDNMRARIEKGIFGFCDAKVSVTFYDLQ